MVVSDRADDQVGIGRARDTVEFQVESLPVAVGQKDGFTWKRIEKLAADFLPKPRILHPWPSERFAVKHPRWEKPYAGNPHVRICAGGVQ
jgi:hypothetical protein